MTRNRNLAGSASLAAWVALILPGLTLAADPQSAKRPNILLILADNWAWPHASAYGDRVVKTPTFDRVAREGVLFQNAFCLSPSCSASRAALLTGQAVHRLEDGANLWGRLPARFAVYPDILERSGYAVGYTGKGWGPGSVEESGRKRNPAGPQFDNFETFLDSVPQGKPFCFWLGSRDPHRRWNTGAEFLKELRRDRVEVPAYLPDRPEVREDILAYYAEVQKFDREAGQTLRLLESRGLAENTLVVIAGDNGWQMPRGLANLYDGGTHVPLAVRWPVRVEAGRTEDAFVNFDDFAPTFLEAAGLKPPAEMTGRSLLPLLEGRPVERRDHVFLERERHANVRRGNRSYPARAIRTRKFLYIGNFEPSLWPAGDPELYFAVGPYGDVDGSPTKQLILEGRDDPDLARFYEIGFAKRPAEELYDLEKDPWQTRNVAEEPAYAASKKQLRERLERWMARTGDPRARNPADDRWDRFPYYGRRARTNR